MGDGFLLTVLLISVESTHRGVNFRDSHIKNTNNKNLYPMKIIIIIVMQCNNNIHLLQHWKYSIVHLNLQVTKVSSETSKLAMRT